VPAGILIHQMKELMLHTDLKREDTIFYFHHLRVDDVELADLLPGRRGHAGAL
jgi:hypothetical protein